MAELEKIQEDFQIRVDVSKEAKELQTAWKELNHLHQAANEAPGKDGMWTFDMVGRERHEEKREREYEAWLEECATKRAQVEVVQGISWKGGVHK